MLLIKYFTTYRLLLSTFVLSGRLKTKWEMVEVLIQMAF